jgi:hypothetical protein
MAYSSPSHPQVPVVSYTTSVLAEPDPEVTARRSRERGELRGCRPFGWLCRQAPGSLLLGRAAGARGGAYRPGAYRDGDS